MERTGKILVTGCRGQLGSDLVRMLSESHEVVGIDIEDADIRNADQVSSVITYLRPDIVLHAAAFTDVDACESNAETAMTVNAEGTCHVAEACASIGARMVYYSTDYVFDGNKAAPYDEDDLARPSTVYGQSKLAGEQAVLESLDDYIILRVAWMYGRHGKNFVKTMLRLGRDQVDQRAAGADVAPLKVVGDQYGNPTWTEDIVRQTKKIMGLGVKGLFHASSEGETTWYQLARDVFSILQIDVAVTKCTTAEFPRPALRPRRSSLENKRLKAYGLNLMRDYREALSQFLGALVEVREE